MEILSVIGLIIIGVLIFELIIFFHEGGHFITAKKSGVKVNEFALGMGPKLFSFKKGETTYSLRLFPIGGYCAMEGEDEDSDNPRAFNNAKIWKRMIIIIAGAIMNIVLGFLLMFIIVVQQPYFVSTTVDTFEPNAYTANSGLEEGDQIVKLNNYDIWNYRDFAFAMGTMKCAEVDGDSLNIYKEDCTNQLTNLYISIVNDSSLTDTESANIYSAFSEKCKLINDTTTKEEATTTFEQCYKDLCQIAGLTDYTIPEIEIQNTRQRYRTDITVMRNGEKVELEDVDFYTVKSVDSDTPEVRWDFYLQPIDKTFSTVISESFSQTVSVARMVWASLAGLVTGQFGFNEVSGPVGITTAISQVASEGLERSFLDAVNNIILVMVIITVNLGIFNMLPFPALDGGRFVMLLIEAIFRKPIPRKIEAGINATGLAILFMFMIAVTFKDIWQLFGG